MNNRQKVFKQLRNARYAILSARRRKKSKMLALLRSHLNSITAEEFAEEIREIVGEPTPKGWVSIEDDLPGLMGKDLMKGYSIYKVKKANGNELKCTVADGMTWYHRAKKAGITHWWND